MVIVENGELRVERFAPSPRPARCFFEWVYFSNVASSIDGAGVYMTRANSGRLLAQQEDRRSTAAAWPSPCRTPPRPPPTPSPTTSASRRWRA